MIQELLGGSNVGLIGGERSKFSSPPCGGILDSSPSHNSPSPSSSSAAPTAVSAAATSENLRCPRCDSSNTKFCYYNNYNLTQPRHFCKTCRRYWTKGGALRNVPIGGGCRKNKNTTITAAKSSTSTAGKMKTPAEMAKVGLFSSFDQVETLSSNPIIWASSQNSHFLSLFRPNQNQNQNPNPNHLQMINSVKEEAGNGNGMLFTPPHMTSDHASRALGFDPLGPAHLYRNQSLPSHQGIIHDEIQNNGLQELYQRLRSSPACYPDHTPLILGNMGSANSTILESAPVAAGNQLGFSWNNTLSWPTDLPTINGAYP